MKRYALGLLVVLAGCYSQSAVPAMVVSPLMLEGPPIYALLGERQELALSSQQISTLDSIAEQLQTENRALMQELRQKGTESRSRPGWFQVYETERPVLDSIRGNNREAAEGVRAALSTEQQSTACRLFERDERLRGSSREREQERERERERRRELGSAMAQVDSMFGMGTRVWPWCGRGATPTQ